MDQSLSAHRRRPPPRGHRKRSARGRLPAASPSNAHVGEPIVVTADVFADGHDVVRAVLLSRQQGESAGRIAPLTSLGNDAWRGEFKLAEVGRYEYRRSAAGSMALTPGTAI